MTAQRTFLAASQAFLIFGISCFDFGFNNSNDGVTMPVFAYDGVSRDTGTASAQSTNPGFSMML